MTKAQWARDLYAGAVKFGEKADEVFCRKDICSINGCHVTLFKTVDITLGQIERAKMYAYRNWDVVHIAVVKVPALARIGTKCPCDTCASFRSCKGQGPCQEYYEWEKNNASKR